MAGRVLLHFTLVWRVTRTTVSRMDDDDAAAAALRLLLNEGDLPIRSSVNRTSAKRKSISKKAAIVESDCKKLKVPNSPGKARRRTHRQPQEVEGIFNSEGELHLLDATTSIVYSSVRDKHGDLVPVGVYDKEQKEIVLQQVEPDAVEQRSSESKVDQAITKPAQRVREVLPELGFASEPDDHCETSLEAYEHIKPLLLRVCKDLKKDACDLRLYDPYYCTGKTKKLLQHLGFSNVYNENEDFYQKLRQGTIPAHDCLITNPPFSGSHIEMLLKHCCSSKIPWLILMPTYVATKDYYQDLALTSGRSRAVDTPLYVVPRKRCATLTRTPLLLFQSHGQHRQQLETRKGCFIASYLKHAFMARKHRYNYWTPKNVQARNLKARKDGRTSPFVTMWFGQFFHLNDEILNMALQKTWRKQPFRLYKNVDDIPDGIVCE